MKLHVFSLFVAGGVFLASEVEARIYQWVDPETGTAQWSGRPPAWYRGGRGGPRVLVFENGRLIDDTAAGVPDAERGALRARAFALRPASPSPSPDRDRSDPDKGIDGEIPVTGLSGDAGQGERTESEESRAEEPLPGVDQATIERLKAIIGAWDRRQTEAAKRFLEGPLEDPGGAGEDPEPAPAPR